MRRVSTCFARRWRLARRRFLAVRAVPRPRGCVPRRCGTRPSGWTCSSSALRFRVDTAGPVSSLTMAPRSPAGGFACRRVTRVAGFPQPFCNESARFRVRVYAGSIGACFFKCTLGLGMCILKHAPRPAFAVIPLRAAVFRARNFARIFVVMGASDAALKLADRGGTGRVAGLVLTLLQTQGLDSPAQGPPPRLIYARKVFLKCFLDSKFN